MNDRYVAEIREIKDNSETSSVNPNKQPTSLVDKNLTIRNSVILVQGVSLVKRSIDFVSADYGNLTGNNIAQNRINSAKSILGSVANVGFSFAISPVAGAIALAGEVINTSFTAISRQIDIDNQNAQISAFRERIGKVKTGGGR